MAARKRPRRDAGRPRGEPIARSILVATLDELASAGLEALSVERVAKRADVNKTTVYRRWPTREALVAAALQGIAQEMSAQIPDTGTLNGDLLAIAIPVAELATDPRGRALLRAVLSETMTLSLTEITRGATPDAPDTLIDRAARRGECRADVDLEQLTSLLVGAILHRAVLERETVSLEWLTSVVDLLSLGLRPRR